VPPDLDIDWLDAFDLTADNEMPGRRPGRPDVRLTVPGCRLRDRLARLERPHEDKHGLNSRVRGPDPAAVVGHEKAGEAGP